MQLNFDPFKTKLPVADIVVDVKRSLAAANTLIVSAPPGAGKSTVLPLALVGEPWLEGKKVVVLEPRRLAASSIAARMADLLNEPVGRTIGYHIRFEKKVSSDTQIEVVTEGILTRRLQVDNALEDIGLVIFDEFHERSIHADIALALCREAQQILRPDLRILVMSATLNVPELSQMLRAPVIESKGQMFPVEIIYTGEQDLQQLPENCSRTISRALQEKEGDLLAFLPGQAEIRKCEEILRRQLRDVSVHALYGQLSHAEQQAAILPDAGGKRKVVLATSIAETSLTIEGIRMVVDSGYARKSTFDPKTGLSGLRTVQITIDSADQRAGRAGRLSAGTCYRMWSAATQQRLAPYRSPEILETDLSPLLLDVLEWGITDINSLCWLDTPPASSMASAAELLTQLNAMENGRITAQGKQIHRLPCHPRLANMLLLARQMEKLGLATDIAALLEEKDPLDRLAGVDLNLRIEALRRYRTEGRKERQWNRIEKTASAYRRLFNIDPENTPVDHYQTGLLLAYAYPERIASVKPGNIGQFQLANGQQGLVSKEDDLAHENWLAIAQLDAQRGQGKIFIAAPLNPKDLYSLAKESETIRWDSRQKALIASIDLRIGSIVLQSKVIKSPDEEKVVAAISTALEAEGESLLNFNEEIEHWQNRVLSLKIWNPEQDWPDVSTSALLKNNRDWLGFYLTQVRKADDLRRIDLLKVLQHSLSYDQQKLLDALAPIGLVVPSGSTIKIKYFSRGEDPVLAVRLQEIFGLLDTPSINDGRKSLVIHLLSPGFKPVQVTSDLRSFWTSTYFEVRKELKRRYPKHSWPEDPLEAEAVRGVRRR